MRLLSFQTWDEAAATYEASGEEARRFAAIAAHPGAVKVIRAEVTFFHEGIDSEAPQGDKGEGARVDRSELSADFRQLDLHI